MGRTVTVELSDEEYARFEQEAAATSRTPAEVIGATVRRHASLLASRQLPASAEEPAQFTGPITAAEVGRAMRKSAERIAPRTGQSPEEIIADFQARIRATPQSNLTEEEREAAQKRLESYFGSVDSGDPHSSDNERIDADLAREYGRGLKWDE